MKKLLLLVLFAAISVCSFGCKENDDNEIPPLLIGKWINTQVNGIPIQTDNVFFMQLRNDQTQLFAKGFDLDTANREWMENSKYTYSSDGRVLSINGTDVLGKQYKMQFNILTLDNDQLIYAVKSFTIDGVPFTDTNTYTCKRITEDYSTQFVGVWYGKCISQGNPDTSYHYWEYFADGTYNYYYQNDADEWVKKTDNNGKYFLYGSVMASNYTNDLINGGTGKAYECWNFSIEDDKMTWGGIRKGNKSVIYRMQKVAAPPVK